MSIIALHGFLGQPQDFDALEISGLRVIDIFSTQICHLSNWSLRFNNYILKNQIIMGYSLGARLALNCLINNPGNYNAAIIISAHPGLVNINQKIKRFEADKTWARRFLHEPWDLLMHDWENQAVFSASPKLMRKESDFDRESLARALSYFSLGTQEYLVAKINDLNLPILWLLAKDEAKNVLEIKLKHSLSRLIFMPKGGHRFMFAYPKATSMLIQSFMRSLE